MSVSVRSQGHAHRALRPEVRRLLPGEWSADGKRVLDFRPRGEPPLAHPDGEFNLVCAIGSFSRLTDRWADWLLEVHRVLAPDGLMVATFMGRRVSERLAGEAWDEDRVGMNVLRSWDPPALGDPVVLHSEWWIRAHWGRAFEIVEIDADGEIEVEGPPGLTPAGHAWALLRRRAVSLTREELERAEPEEPRELLAARHNVRQLHRLIDEAGAGTRAELDALRESFHGELGRKSARLAQLEKLNLDYTSTVSWRITRPLRAARRFLRARRP